VILLYPSISPIIGNISLNVTLSGSNPINAITYFVTPFFNITSSDPYNPYAFYAVGNMLRSWSCNASGTVTGFSYSKAYLQSDLQGISIIESANNYKNTGTSLSDDTCLSTIFTISDAFGDTIKTTDCIYSLNIGYRYKGNSSTFIITIQ
jgi:hypothetical protein